MMSPPAPLLRVGRGLQEAQPGLGGTGLGSVRVEFASSLRRHVECPPQSVDSGSLRTVLEAALSAAPDLAPYVFDDQRCIRKHVAVFINQSMVMDRQHLEQIVRSGDKVLVIQALTGG